MVKSNKTPRKYIVLTQEDLEAVAIQAAEIARRAIEEEFKKDPWPERFFTCKQVREFLHISEATLYRWEKAGILIPVKIAGINRYRKTDLERLTSQ